MSFVGIDRDHMMTNMLFGLLLMAAPGPGPKHTTAVKTSVEPLNRTKLLRMVNELRSKGCQCGDTWYNPAPPLTWNEQLEAAAQAHSNDMLRRKYFAHRSPEGTNAGARIDKAGYNWGAFGENIGMGYKDELEVVAGWKASPGHCKNMLNPNFKEMGVARAGNYWTQNLARQ